MSCVLRRGEFFTVSSSNLTCDACPTDTASCDYTGKSDEDVPVGAVVVPLAGYWHSSPLSPQIHVCPVEAACTESSRVLLTQYQKDLVYGNRTLNVTEYNQLQCNDGYTGEAWQSQYAWVAGVASCCFTQSLRGWKAWCALK